MLPDSLTFSEGNLTIQGTAGTINAHQGGGYMLYAELRDAAIMLSGVFDWQEIQSQKANFESSSELYGEDIIAFEWDGSIGKFWSVDGTQYELGEEQMNSYFYNMVLKFEGNESTPAEAVAGVELVTLTSRQKTIHLPTDVFDVLRRFVNECTEFNPERGRHTCHFDIRWDTSLSAVYRSLSGFRFVSAQRECIEVSDKHIETLLGMVAGSNKIVFLN